MKPPTVAFTRDEVEAWTTSQAVAVGIAFLPTALQGRFRRMMFEAMDIEAQAGVSRQRRDAMIREHDRAFNSPAMSLTARAKSIATDLARASAARLVTTRLFSAQEILKTNRGKTLGYRRIMEIIQ